MSEAEFLVDPSAARIRQIIEEGFIKKQKQTVVVAFRGKMATHMLLLRLCSRQGRQGQNCGGIFVYYIFYDIFYNFYQMFYSFQVHFKRKCQE